MIAPAETVTLEFLAKQLQQMASEVASLRRDLFTLTTITVEVERKFPAVLAEVRARVAPSHSFRRRQSL